MHEDEGEVRVAQSTGRQKLREINERREAALLRVNNQRQRQTTIKERLQAKLRMRQEE